MPESTYPWRDGRSLRQVIDDTRPWLERRRLVRKGPGCGKAAVAALAERLKGRLPDDVRAFLLAVEPIPMFHRGKIRDDGPGEFFFYGPDARELRWQSLAKWAPEADWHDARGLAIGQTGYGDVLYWVEGHRAHPDGCIAVDDHEVAMGDLQYAVLARSLAELVAKVVHIKGLSPGLMDDPLDDDDDDDDGEDEDDDSDFDLDFGAASQLLFNQEYAELNPTSARGKAAPASDADAPWPDPDAEDLTLSAHAAEELPDLKPLKRLRELTLQIGECRFDLDRGDYVVDCGPPVDLARLLPSATLERLLCQNTDLRRLDALSECPNLRRLTFHQCRLELGNGPIALPRLEEFEAPGSTLADLSPVAKSPQLRLLWIPGTRVCDLGPVAGFAHVETVSICDTAVADLGPLATLPSLRTLEVTKGQFAAAALKAFRAARPDVTIEQRPPDAPALILGDGDAH